MKKTQKTDPFWCGRQVVPSLSPRSPHFVAISVEFIPCVYVKLVKKVIATHPRMGNDSHQKYMYTVGTIEIIYLFTYLLTYLLIFTTLRSGIWDHSLARVADVRSTHMPICRYRHTIRPFISW